MVLSDGMGHGIKANVLSTLTASLIVNFDFDRHSIRQMAAMVLKSLPVCSVRKISYSTFTIVDIHMDTGKAVIIQHDNPPCMVCRDGKLLDLAWESLSVQGEHSMQTIKSAVFDIRRDDRLVMLSDGVTQSGVGTERYPFGWGEKNAGDYFLQAISRDPSVSSHELASEILCQSVKNDGNAPNDDISCAVVHIREPKSVLLCTCPPYSEKENRKLCETIYRFNGRRIICGYHLAKLVSELTGNVIHKNDFSPDPDVQPSWSMEGIELITESLTTMNKILDILEHYDHFTFEEGPAFDACRILLAGDRIDFLAGLSRGNGGMYMVDEFELRRKVVKRIAAVLRSKFMKEVSIRYL